MRSGENLNLQEEMKSSEDNSVDKQKIVFFLLSSLKYMWMFKEKYDLWVGDIKYADAIHITTRL